MNLVIVESPTKARTLSRFLGSDYRVEATMGHIRDLPEDNLGVLIEKDFQPQYVLVAKKKDILVSIRKAALDAEKIYLATDPDREGEAIAYHVAYLISKNSKFEARNPKQIQNTNDKNPKQELFRITFHEITKTVIDEALAHPGEINMDLVEAQTARRILDRLVGYKLSPLLWQKIRKGLSAGRVQSVAVRLIVEKEREIEKFVPIEYWDIEALLQKTSGKESFWTKLVKKNNEKAIVGNEKESKEVIAELEKAKYKVVLIEKKEVKRNPAPPFTTSTLQQAAANRLGWTSKKTMNVAQSLYENGLITYHRTDSTNIAIAAINQARSFIKENYGDSYLPSEHRFYATKSKMAQEAHEAVRPTDVQFKVQSASWRTKFKVDGDGEKLGGDMAKLYEVIWKRFLTCQMNPEVVELTTIDTEAKNGNTYLFESKGEKQVFDGWRKLYQKGEDEENKEPSNGLLDLQENEDLNLKELKPTQRFTQPPARFNEASLIKTMEELGIGRPSTYAPTISTIQDRQYVEKQEKQFVPTSLGFAVNDFLVKYFSDILDYQFTAKMEDDLDEIANGEKQRVPVLKEFYEPFSKKLGKVEKNAERVAVRTEATGEKCPECKEGNEIIRLGRFGKFLACDRFPDCKYRAPYIQKVLGIKCPKCGGDIVYKKTKKGKGFYGCSNWPKCDYASWHKPSETQNSNLPEKISAKFNGAGKSQSLQEKN